MIGHVFTISSVCSTKQFLFYAGFIKKSNYLGKQCKWQATLRFCIPARAGRSCKNACWGYPQTPNKTQDKSCGYAFNITLFFQKPLRGLYKSASFIVQAIAFKQMGKYISHQKDLLQVVSSDERTIVETFIHLKNGGTIDFNLMSETLFVWSKKWIAEYS